MDRLEEIARELIGLYQQHAMILGDEVRAKVEGFQRSQETSVSGRERDGQWQGLEATVQAFKVQGQIKALQEERDMLRFRVEHAEMIRG